MQLDRLRLGLLVVLAVVLGASLIMSLWFAAAGSALSIVGILTAPRSKP